MKFIDKLWLGLSLVLISQIVLATDVMTFSKGQRSAKDIERDGYRKGPDIVRLADIRSGMVIADVLGGSGYYSELLSEVVGSSGQVYLHNNQAYMPYIEKELAARLADNRLTNVIRHDKETDNLSLGTGKFDAIFFVLGYHDLYHKAEGWDIDKEGFLAQINQALKPGGKLVIVDHSAIEKSGVEHAQKLHRIDKMYVIDELSDKGFNLIKQSNLLANPEDDMMISPFNPSIRGKTDRFVLVFSKMM